MACGYQLNAWLMACTNCDGGCSCIKTDDDFLASFVVNFLEADPSAQAVIVQAGHSLGVGSGWPESMDEGSVKDEVVTTVTNRLPHCPLCGGISIN